MTSLVACLLHHAGDFDVTVIDRNADALAKLARGGIATRVVETADSHALATALKSHRAVGRLIADPDNDLLFSAASLWEIVIKRTVGRADFRVDARLLRRSLLGNGYLELPIASDHVTAVESLPAIHSDPFDRILVAQAIVEGVTLVTSDRTVAQYSGPIRKV